MADYDEQIFEDYVERQPRCRAIELKSSNVMEVSQWLRANGWGTRLVDGRDELTLEVFSGKESLFVADVYAGDAILQCDRDRSRLSIIPGVEFRATWQKESGG